MGLHLYLGLKPVAAYEGCRAQIFLIFKTKFQDPAGSNPNVITPI